LMKKWE